MALSANVYFCERYFGHKSHSKAPYRVEKDDPWATVRQEALGGRPSPAMRQWTHDYIEKHPETTFTEAKKMWLALPEEQRKAKEDERVRALEAYEKQEAEWMVAKMRELSKRPRPKKAEAAAPDNRATKKGKGDASKGTSASNNEKRKK